MIYSLPSPHPHTHSEHGDQDPLEVTRGVTADIILEALPIIWFNMRQSQICSYIFCGY